MERPSRKEEKYLPNKYDKIDHVKVINLNNKFTRNNYHFKYIYTVNKSLFKNKK